ncbi:MAG: right-handed parallel beta-helix repeat-containing protein [Limisphaerales bacterium]
MTSKIFIKLLSVVICASALLLAGFCNAATLDITTFGGHAGDGSDTTPAVRKALAECRKSGSHTLIFPKGRYDFWPDRAEDGYYFISNNDEGLKRIAFLLRAMKDLEIDGQGSTFIFHGFLNPFVLDGAKNVTLKNFSIDFARTFHSEGKILGENPGGLDVEFSAAYPYRVDNNILVFTDGGDKPPRETTTTSTEVFYPFSNLLEFDPVKRETAFLAPDYWCGNGLAVKELGGHKVRLLKPGLKGTPGNIMVFGAKDRKVPGITITDSEDTLLDHVTIYHSGGMGIIGQRSRNINLQDVQVTPTPGSGRVVSATADATHFSNCSGKIEMSHCLFECEMDDHCNIHGIYARVASRPDDTTVVVQLVHPQQFGFDFIKPGMRLELVHGASMITFGETEVKSVERINKEFTRVVCRKPLPAELQAGDVVAETGHYPEVYIHDCRMRGNRARGLLLGSRGRTVIENNYFHEPGAALLFEGDARYWFEQAGVRDCVIRGNTFDNCLYGVWGEAVIQVGSGIAESERAQSRYNRNILIENNTFHGFDPRLLKAYSVDAMTMQHNQIERTEDYPAAHPNAKRYDIADSDHVSIDTGEGPSVQDQPAKP